MSHTPGPWRSDGRVVGWNSGQCPGIAVWADIGGGVSSPVCTVTPDTTKQDPVFGHGGSFHPFDDACLIAAAPDLLAALKRVRAEISEAELNYSSLVPAIDSAVAKADGRS